MDNKTNAILKTIHVTEKANLLQSLCEQDNNPCIAKFKKAKYVFIVDPKANKAQIKTAVEELYKDQKIKVDQVNTINLPRKKKKARGKRRMGYTSQIRKAIVTLREGDTIDLEI